MKPHRNDPCPCGSRKRYKNCCAGRQSKLSGSARGALIAGVIAVVGVLAAAKVYRGEPSSVGAAPVTSPLSSTAPLTLPGGAPAPAPPGEAPPGKLWSAEHGHWHDKVLTPQPDGPVPPGGVWVPEHGHWHDANGAAIPADGQAVATPADGQMVATPADGQMEATSQGPAQPVPQPEAPLPPRNDWAPKHGGPLHHDEQASPVAPQDATSGQPTPPVPQPEAPPQGN